MANFGGYLKVSTAATVRVYVRADDHITAGTAVADGAWTLKQLMKAGGAFAGVTPVITERAYGWYDIPLTSAHTDTLGRLVLHLEAPGVDVVDWYWEVTAYGEGYASIGAIDAGAITAAAIADAAIDAATFANNAITAAALAADAGGEIADAVLEELVADHSGTGGSLAAYVASINTIATATYNTLADYATELLGLAHKNVLIDNTTNTVDGMTAARIRVFADEVDAAAATIDAGGLEGAIASYTVTATFESVGKLASYRVVKD